MLLSEASGGVPADMPIAPAAISPAKTIVVLYLLGHAMTVSYTLSPLVPTQRTLIPPCLICLSRYLDWEDETWRVTCPLASQIYIQLVLLGVFCRMHTASPDCVAQPAGRSYDVGMLFLIDSHCAVVEDPCLLLPRSAEIFDVVVSVDKW